MWDTSIPYLGTMKGQSLSPKGNSQWPREVFWVPKKDDLIKRPSGSQEETKMLFLSIRAHHDLIPEIVAIVSVSLCAVYHIVLCNLLWPVFLNFPSPHKNLWRQRTSLYSSMSLKLQEKLICPKSGGLCTKLGSGQGSNASEARDAKNVMKINHVIWPYRFLGSFYIVSVQRQILPTSKIYKQRAVKFLILLNSNNAFVD